eukprot:TRINITY_DN10380_c0_g1_i5.p1 TRINITY_DN10380_c0_g1~~TRINITY_DN10380_c0_g1_i5.p1  ORF type:complete len:249 (+),score=41.99 TRINITY_DN10380_c0_g1_i5:168-914(+)
MLRSLVGSEMCIRDSCGVPPWSLDMLGLCSDAMAQVDTISGRLIWSNRQFDQLVLRVGCGDPLEGRRHLHSWFLQGVGPGREHRIERTTELQGIRTTLSSVACANRASGLKRVLWALREQRLYQAGPPEGDDEGAGSGESGRLWLDEAPRQHEEMAGLEQGELQAPKRPSSDLQAHDREAVEDSRYADPEIKVVKDHAQSIPGTAKRHSPSGRWCCCGIGMGSVPPPSQGSLSSGRTSSATSGAAGRV